MGGIHTTRSNERAPKESSTAYGKILTFVPLKLWAGLIWNPFSQWLNTWVVRLVFARLAVPRWRYFPAVGSVLGRGWLGYVYMLFPCQYVLLSSCTRVQYNGFRLLFDFVERFLNAFNAASSDFLRFYTFLSGGTWTKRCSTAFRLLFFLFFCFKKRKKHQKSALLSCWWSSTGRNGNHQ
jgi:hypothetical protein